MVNDTCTEKVQSSISRTISCLLLAGCLARKIRQPLTFKPLVPFSLIVMYTVHYGYSGYE